VLVAARYLLELRSTSGPRPSRTARRRSGTRSVIGQVLACSLQLTPRRTANTSRRSSSWTSPRSSAPDASQCTSWRQSPSSTRSSSTVEAALCPGRRPAGLACTYLHATPASPLPRRVELPRRRLPQVPMATVWAWVWLVVVPVDATDQVVFLACGINPQTCASCLRQSGIRWAGGRGVTHPGPES
jgi:hypothetical protein